MALAFRAKTDAVDTSGAVTTLSINKPAGTVDGDYILIAANIGGAPNSGPSGFTQLTSTTDSNGGRLVVWGKLAASEGASWSVGFNLGIILRLMALTYSGVKLKHDVSGSQSNASSTNAVAPAITLAGAGETVVGFWARTFNSVSGSWNTIASGFTSEDSQGTQPMMIAGEKVFSSSGSTGTQTTTMNLADVNSGALCAIFEDIGGAPLFFGSA